MLKQIGFILTLAATAILSSQSQAMPIQPLGDDASMVVKVANGCGPGWYRGPGGAVTGSVEAPIREGTGARIRAVTAGTAALPDIGGAPGVIAATRPITAGCRAAAGNSAPTSPENRRGGFLASRPHERIGG